ncbi:hypothetical protein BGZ60DRAFT_405564 [Tricladium varicosporioides]|nr:hypothetical protein BGZ60DRAFT_405564 [Hymenoscyphus varicosporioides]
MEELNTSPKELGLEPEEESLPKDEAPPQEEGSARISVHEQSTSFVPSINNDIDIDIDIESISISSIGTPEPRLVPYPFQNTGPVTLDNPNQENPPELRETPSRKEIPELDPHFATYGIPELDSTNYRPSPIPPNELPQSLSRPLPYPPQGPPLDTDYSNLNSRPGNERPSQNHTPSPSRGAPGIPQSKEDYPTYLQAQSYQEPLAPNRTPPPRPPYGPDSFLGRASGDSAHYQQDTNQGPRASMNDVAQGYHPQIQSKWVPEPEEKRKAHFWKKNR